MIKFSRWLISNNFIITSEYDDITNRMMFKKGDKYFSLSPQYYGNKIGYYYLQVKKYDYPFYKFDGEFIGSAEIQKNLILIMEKFLIENEGF